MDSHSQIPLKLSKHSVFYSLFCSNRSQALHRRVAFNHVPEDKFSSRKRDVEVVHISDMQYDCALLRAQIDLIRKDPSVLTSQGKPIWSSIQVI